MVDEPEHRHEIDRALAPGSRACGHDEPDPREGRAELARPSRWAACGCPWSRPDEDEREAVRTALERHGLLGATRLTGALRVLPLGGLGEIGKNMTVIEYEDRIVLVDVGLRFPTAEMMGIDLVLPDFTYLRERVAGHRGDRRHARTRGSSRRAALGAARARRPGHPARLRRPAHDGDGTLQARRAPAGQGRRHERPARRQDHRPRARSRSSSST